MNRAQYILNGIAFSIAIIGFGLTASKAASADINDYTADLRPSVTVAGSIVTLGDLFEGDIMRPEKAIAKAPEPGQRFILGAKWLADVARTYGIDWRPSNAYDRATVYRPGQTIGQDAMIDEVRNALVEQGLPGDFGVELTTPLSNITVSTEVIPEIGVREAFFDAQTRLFSAVVEVPRGEPNAQFIPVRGIAFPTVMVPTVDRSVSKNTIITDAMIQWTDIAADKIRRDTIMDARFLVGKSPRSYLRAGDPVRSSDVIQVNLVDVPVLRHDLREDTEITSAHIQWVTMNGADLSDNVITDANRLVGLSPRRFLASGAPIRSSDVHAVVPVEVAVALRDIRRGSTINERDFQWVTMNEHELSGDIMFDDVDVEGLQARRTIRSGQVFRNRDLRTPVVVDRGKIVTILLDTPHMRLSAKGKAMENGGTRDTIKVMNTLSNKTILATIIDSETVRVESLQTAMK
ncbi:MAG: flagellar basal body P-ring formation protein FlgA [Alphaproteobacteria bacterium]|nr:flagellar basal body P-ring formation protein FlgA [Alphaproteobacteria bacterium]